MRTTLTIDDDVLSAATSIADRDGRTAGKVLSDLARQALTRAAPRRTRSGVPLLPVTNPNAIVTLEMVSELRDESP